MHVTSTTQVGSFFCNPRERMQACRAQAFTLADGHASRRPSKIPGLIPHDFPRRSAAAVTWCHRGKLLILLSGSAGLHLVGTRKKTG